MTTATVGTIENPSSSTLPGVHSAVATILMFLAVAGGLIGLLFASQATAGVAILAFAILVAIWARIVQANYHQQALLEALRQR